jgi:hypothetical protein
MDMTPEELEYENAMRVAYDAGYDAGYARWKEDPDNVVDSPNEEYWFSLGFNEGYHEAGDVANAWRFYGAE